MMLLNNGAAGERQIVSPAIIHTLRMAAVGPPSCAGRKPSDSRRPVTGVTARSGGSAHPRPEAISAIGIHGRWIYVDCARGVAIVKQSSLPRSVDVDIDQYVINAFDAVIGHLAGWTPAGA